MTQSLDGSVSAVAETAYEQLARTTWGLYLTQVEDEALADALAIVGRPTTALEIGCDAGRRPVRLANQGWHVTCVDINSDALKICQRRIPDANCVLASPDDRRIPAADHSVKLLLCIEVEVVLISDWFLAEAHRVLVDGGCLVSTMTNRMSYRVWLHNVLEMIKPRTQGDVHGSANYRFTYAEWEKKLSNAGFTMRQSTGFCWLPFHRDSNSPFVPLTTKAERILGLRHLPQLSPWVISIAQNRL
jgi:ubiquinone/menaquinone biosynthesis C-methylase UbiE